MSWCPKCGSGQISDPKYSDTRRISRGNHLIDLPEECMRWWCVRCGYEELTACKDKPGEGEK